MKKHIFIIRSILLLFLFFRIILPFPLTAKSTPLYNISNTEKSKNSNSINNFTQKTTDLTTCNNGVILTPESVFIDNRIDGIRNWVGGYFKGRFEDCSHIKLEWDIDESSVGEVKSYRLYRRGWDESSYTLIQTLAADIKSYVDVVDVNASKPVWYYNLYVDKVTPDGTSISNNIAIWQVKDFYTKESLNIIPDAKVWIANQPGNSLSTESRLSLVDTLQWPNLSKEIGGIVLYRSSLMTGSISELRNLTNVANKLKIPLGVETSGFQNIETTEKSQLGEKSFESEMRAYRNLLTPISQGGAGGKLDYIFFDGPIHSAVYPNDKDLGLITVEEAAWELTDLMLLWRQNFPQVKFYLISNFSNWGWNGEPARNTHNLSQFGWGEYKHVLDTLIPLSIQRGVPFEGLVSDYAYEAFLNEGSSDQINVIKNIDYRIRLKELSEYVKNKNLKFIMCLNEVRGGYSNNKVYSMNVINYLEEALQYGIIPDEVIVQSWNPYPDSWLPESQEGTMTNLGLKIANRLRYGNENGVISSAPNYAQINFADISKKIIVYPNPTFGLFNIETNETIKKVQVYNVFGQLILEKLHPNSLDFNLAASESGLYLIVVETLTNTHTRKLLKI